MSGLRRVARRTASTLLAFAAAAAAAMGQEAPRWRGPEHQDRGLPDPVALWAPYDPQADHPANRCFRAIWLTELVPAEVAFALPREEARRAGADWLHFGKRPGTPTDRRLFGGDGLQLPRESFADEEAALLRTALAELDGPALADLRRRPDLAVLLQNDLLRAARRLLDTGGNADLLGPLLAAARRLALSAEVLLDPALGTLRHEGLEEFDPAFGAAALVEIDRRSTRLFDAERTLLWSRVFFVWPEPEALPGRLAAIRDGAAPEIPDGAAAALTQGIVALDDEGHARATSVLVDVRIQRSAPPTDDGAGAADGVDFRVFWLERERLRSAGPGAGKGAFRALHADDQALFRDYGTQKHTTVAAQCALCHRRTETPEPELEGMPILRKSAAPRIAASPDVRLRLAERQFAAFLAQLEQAAR